MALVLTSSMTSSGCMPDSILGDRPVDAARDGVLDALRIDPTDVAQHPLGLVVVEGDVLQVRHGLVAPVA